MVEQHIQAVMQRPAAVDQENANLRQQHIVIDSQPSAVAGGAAGIDVVVDGLARNRIERLLENMTQQSEVASKKPRTSLL